MHKAHGSEKNREKSGKDSPLLEWQTCDNEAEWQSAHQEMLVTTHLQPEGTPRPHWVARHWRIGAALLMLLAILGGWTWRVAQRGVDQIQAELRERVELDLQTATTQDDGLRPASEQEIHKLFISAQADNARPLTSTVQLLALPGETAIVKLVTQPGPDQPALRQTRFYRQTAKGWQRTKPDAELWGAPRRLESSHFIFDFRQNDAEVIAAVAPQMDDIYADIERNFELAPNDEKLVIEVTVEHVTGAMLTPQWAYEPLVVPSPAIYLAPVELNDSAILAQSISLPLIEYMGERAMADHAIPTRRRPLLRGLRLWQLWELDLPLAQWQRELVKWLYVDAPKAIVEQTSMLPPHYTEICAMHRLWMLSPTVVGVPLECTAWGDLAWSPSRWGSYVPRTLLDQLSMPLEAWERPFNEAYDPYYFIEPVVIASLLEYALEVYGDEKLPVLLAGLAHYNNWETLVPAVFGVSVPDFEKGWRSYLAQKYSVTLSH